MGEDLGRVFEVTRASQAPAVGSVTLSYDARFLRRKRLTTDQGAFLLLDLPETTNLAPGDALLLADGRTIAVRPRMNLCWPSPALIWRGWPGISETATHPARSMATGC